ncbi:MAG TPA: sugar ABC transporter permease, partial [Firmicutes bacterium]|nr:sugar ABC transporter permease [Bacillota bacterium]
MNKYIKCKMPLIYLVLTIGLFLAIFPYLWMVLSSFKVSGEIY